MLVHTTGVEKDFYPIIPEQNAISVGGRKDMRISAVPLNLCGSVYRRMTHKYLFLGVLS